MKSQHAALLLMTVSLTTLILTTAPSHLAGDPPAPPPEKDQHQESTPADSPKANPFWLRLVSVEMAKDSPLRNDTQFNNPPCVYVAFTATGKKTSYSTKHYGWSVSFPGDSDDEQVLITNDKDIEYTFEVWDSQYRSNKQLFSVGPLSGNALRQQLPPPDPKDPTKPMVLVLENKEKRTSISFAFAGTQVCYRLVNITLPPESSYRKTLPSPPRPYLILKADGKEISRSTIQLGWSADFPKEDENRWCVREGTTIRYSIEVWNARGWDALLFTITGLSGADFCSTVKEPVDKLLGSDVAATVLFERSEPPSE